MMIWMGGPATSTKISRVGRALRLHRVPLPRSQFLTAELVVVVVGTLPAGRPAWSYPPPGAHPRACLGLQSATVVVSAHFWQRLLNLHRSLDGGGIWWLEQSSAQWSFPRRGWRGSAE